MAGYVGQAHEIAHVQDSEGDAEIEPLSRHVSVGKKGQAVEKLPEDDKQVRSQRVSRKK